MFIQLFAICVGAVLYLLGMSWWINVLFVLGAVWFAMAPPRFLLNTITSRYSSVLFQLESDDVYFTIDDGPTPYTHLILDALHECKRLTKSGVETHARATFFVIGSQIAARHDVVSAILAGGHTIGNHDYENRVTAAPGRSRAAILQGLIDTVTAVASVPVPSTRPASSGPVTPIQWFRPGCGAVNGLVLNVAKGLGYNIALGDTYAHDVAFSFLPAPIAQWILTRFYAWRVRPGSIVILHDGSEARARNSAAVIRYLAQVYPKTRFCALPQ